MMLMIAKKRYLLVPLLCLTLTYTTAALVGRGIYLSLTLSELGAVEVVGAVGLLLASALLLIAFIRYWKTKGHETFVPAKGLSYLVLALILLLSAGEELSWGQHFLNIETPDAIGSVNRQNEINLHNLIISTPGGQTINVSIWTSRLFNMFWLLWAVILPIVSALYEPARLRLNNLMPIIPWSLGLLFVANYGLFRASLLVFSVGRHTGMNEVKESNFGVLFALVAAYVLGDMMKLESATSIPAQET